MTYSRVCGRVNGYQQGASGAFRDSVISGQGLEGYMLMVSPSHMELQAHVNTSGHLLQHSTKLIPTTIRSITVPAQTSMKPGLIKSLHSLETITFVLLATLDLDLATLEYIQKTLYGMVRGVVLLIPAVN